MAGQAASERVLSDWRCASCGDPMANGHLMTCQRCGIQAFMDSAGCVVGVELDASAVVADPSQVSLLEDKDASAGARSPVGRLRSWIRGRVVTTEKFSLGSTMLLALPIVLAVLFRRAGAGFEVSEGTWNALGAGVAGLFLSVGIALAIAALSAVSGVIVGRLGLLLRNQSSAVLAISGLGVALAVGYGVGLLAFVVMAALRMFSRFSVEIGLPVVVGFGALAFLSGPLLALKFGRISACLSCGVTEERRRRYWGFPGTLRREAFAAILHRILGDGLSRRMLDRLRMGRNDMALKLESFSCSRCGKARLFIDNQTSSVTRSVCLEATAPAGAVLLSGPLLSDAPCAVFLGPPTELIAK